MSIHTHTTQPGLPPGSLVYTGDQTHAAVTITMLDYDANGYFVERETVDPAELAQAIETPAITWIHVTGLHHVSMIDSIGQAFGIHPLLLEDILNSEQRPKIEQANGTVYIILKAVNWHEEAAHTHVEQVSLVIGPTYVLSFLERPSDLFAPVRRRLREGNGRIRQMGADYLAYSLLDTIVDNYFLTLEQISEQIEEIEDGIIENPTPEAVQTIHELRRDLLYLRKAIWPLREVISSLYRGEYTQFRPETLPYLRDIYEHVIQIIDTIETCRDIVSGLLDMYLSTVSNRMNEVMKLLTIIATIFIPLTFITSLYGMNFDYMPELHWPMGYPLVWLTILLIGIALGLYFKRKGWW
jgi:magnesium transporter